MCQPPAFNSSSLPSMGRPSLMNAARASARRLAVFLFVAAAVAQPLLALAQTQTDSRSPGVVQLMGQVEALQAEISKLHGQLEVLTNALDNAQKRQRDMYLDLDTRLRRIEQLSSDAARKEGQQSELEGRLK